MPTRGAKVDQGLRKVPNRERKDDQRGEATDQIFGTEPGRGDDDRRHDGGQRAAEAHTGEGEGYVDVAPLRRGEFEDQGRDGRQHTAHAKTHEDPSGREQRHSGREAGHQHRQGEQGDAGENQPATPDEVGQHTDTDRPDEHPDRRQTTEQTRLCDSQMPRGIGEHERQRRSVGDDVVALKRHAREAEQENTDRGSSSCCRGGGQ